MRGEPGRTRQARQVRLRVGSERTSSTTPRTCTARNRLPEHGRRSCSSRARSNKAMKLTRLSAAPGLNGKAVWMEAPPHARAS